MTPFRLGDLKLILDPAGALLWPEQRLLAIADLHLEKGSACARGGNLVPPFDSRATLERLAALIDRTRPEIVVAVGDSFHDDLGPARLAADDAQALRAMTQSRRFVWVGGNHDPRPHGFGECTPEFRVESVTFRHQSVGGSGEISGHYHPKARITTRAGRIARPCFVADRERILLPAFGAYAGGLDVRSPEIARLFPGGGRAFLLGQNRLFGFALESLG